MFKRKARKIALTNEQREQLKSNQSTDYTPRTSNCIKIDNGYYFINEGQVKFKTNHKLLSKYHSRLLTMLEKHEHLLCLCNLTLRMQHDANDQGLMSRVIKRVIYQLTSKYKITDALYFWIREKKGVNRHYHLTIVVPGDCAISASDLFELVRNNWLEGNYKLTGKKQQAYTIKPARYIYNIKPHSKEFAEFIYHNSYLTKVYSKPKISGVKIHGMNCISI